MRKLGILTAEKAGSGFKPTEVLQFAHLTIQEHSASDHVVKRLLSDDRGPREALVEQFHIGTEDRELPDKKVESNTIARSLYDSADDQLSTKKTITKSALVKIKTEILPRPDVEKEVVDFVQKLVEVGILDDEVDPKQISDVFRGHPIFNEVLTEEEKVILADLLVKQLVLKIPKVARLVVKYHYQRQYGLYPNQLINFLKDIKEMMMTRMGTTQISGRLGMFFNTCSIFKIFSLLSSLWSTAILCGKSLTKPCFDLSLGKLADHPATRDVIIKEIATFVVQHSYNPHTGRVLSVSDMRSLVWDLKCESLPDDYNHNVMDSYPESYSALVTSPLVYFRPTRRFPNVANLEPETPCALKVVGLDANIPEFIPKVTSHIKHLRNIQVLELQWIQGLDKDLSSIYQKITTVFYHSPHLVSIQLSNIDPRLMGLLIQNLPLSVKRLGVGIVEPSGTPKGTFTFPPELHIVCLHLKNCPRIVHDLFRNTTFPDLKILSIRHCCLKGCGPEFVEILKAESICSAEFVEVELNEEDGQILLKNIQEGNLDHVEFLNLLDNEELCPLTEHLETACVQHEITLSMDIEEADYVTPTSSMAGLTKNDVAPAATRNHTEATLVSSFTPEQVQNITTFTSSLTQEQRQSVIALFTFLASDQAQHVRNFFSNVPLEVATLVHHQLQVDIKTLFELLDPQQSFQRFAMLSFEERIGKGILSILRNIGSTFTPEQWQTLNSITRSPHSSTDTYCNDPDPMDHPTNYTNYGKPDI